MERRAFLKAAGLAAGSAWWAWPAQGAASEAEPGVSSMFIDRSKVINRNQNRSTVVSQHGMVCTSQPLASVAGLDVLKAGGNAIDAAVAANATLGVVEPMNCGLGGDLFAIIWIEKERKLYGLNASGRAPYTWNLEEAQRLGLESIPSYSPLAWSVPGCVSGWAAMLERHGTWKLDAVLAPATDYARHGFPISPIISEDWEFDGAEYPTLAAVYGPAHPFGELISVPQLADDLEYLAREGAAGFYQGRIAERIAAYAQTNGGYFTPRDFQDHTATWVDPVSTSYRGHDLWEIPPNGQGIAALQILNLLEHFDIAALEPNSAAHWHLFIEAKKLAYEDRAIYYADPEFEDVPVDWLISKAYAAERVKHIDPERASRDLRPGLQTRGPDTVYLCTADGDGNMVSLIQSLYSGWGSRIVPDGIGFPIQNRGQSFALDPTHKNRLMPHKRPFHTIIPAFLTKDGAAKMAFGVMGGDFQPQGHAQILMNMLDFGMSPQQAGEQPRIEHSGSSSQTGYTMTGGGRIRFEHHTPDAVKVRLAEMGHEIRGGVGAFGGYQSIWREDGPIRYFGGTDPRKDGCAIGW